MVRILQPLAQRADELSVLGRRLIANGVGHVHDGGSGIDYRIEHRAEIIDLRAPRIFSGKFDLVTQPSRALDRFHRDIKGFATTLVQFVFEMDVAGRQERMNPWMRGAFQRLPASVDIGGQRAGKSRNRGAANFAGDLLHRLEVPFGCDRESGFDDIHLQPFQLPRHPQLLFDIHAEARRLFSISQCRVENLDSVHGVLLLLASGPPSPTPNA